MIQTGVTTAAKILFLKSVVNDTCKIALYSGLADIGPDTPAYTTDGEVSGAGYSAGGIRLKGCEVLEDENGGAYLKWENAQWPKISVTAGGYMIYDTSKNNTALFVGSWGADYTSTNGPFTVNIPEKQLILV